MKTAIFAVLLASSAFAQKETEEKLSRKIDLSQIVIECDACLLRPASQYTLVKPRTEFDRMLKVRSNFAPELQKSADRL